MYILFVQMTIRFLVEIGILIAVEFEEFFLAEKTIGGLLLRYETDAGRRKDILVQ